ncbi:hypothetical protein N7476_002074 [Penicillium atrosanguineum]|uniref:Aflatoxin regulatory protein domain-containing protein n=1 Tax=Penicillium atrosanguineum TaxID=1132637 RepID=A0A9W9Q317_9EURO|nr:hypothetical protein N7476_002074 [Penicillium atrosanguineum]
MANKANNFEVFGKASSYNFDLPTELDFTDPELMNPMNPDLMPANLSPASSTNMTDLQLHQTCSEANRTCPSSVLNVLRILCVPPTICLSISEDAFSPQLAGAAHCQIRKMDEVLKINRGVIELVLRVFRCSCSEKSSLQLLLIIVCDRLTAWYHAMSRPNDPLSTSTRSGDEPSERVLTQPITIGEFPMDPAMQLCMRDQLILGELQSVQGMIRKFSDCVQQTKNRDKSARGQRFYDIMSRLLRDQLQAQSILTCRGTDLN